MKIPKPIVILQHGFNVIDKGAGTTDRLKPYYRARGFPIIEWDYGWSGPLTVALKNKHLLTKLKERIRNLHADGYTVIYDGHSNAAAIAYLLTRAKDEAEQPDILALTNPALRRDIVFGSGPKHILIYHSYDDEVVIAGKWWRWALPPCFDRWVPWGDMGRTGYTGKKDLRIANINLTREYNNLTGNMLKFEHSTYYNDDILEIMAPARVRKIQNLMRVMDL